MDKHESINYIELPSKNIQKTKNFFTKVFNWSFKDYGDSYTSFSDETIEGGFYKSDLSVSTKNGSALIVFYSKNLKETQDKIKTFGGIVIQDIFEFPGGHRFHFNDTTGNEFAVWSNTFKSKKLT